MMSSLVQRLAWCAPWLLVLACTPKAEPPPTGAGDSSTPAPGTSTPAPGTSAPAPAASAPKLDGRVFVSQRVTEGGTPRALVEGTQLGVSFHEGTRITADAGCNTLGGRYAVEAGKLVISDSSITEMACLGVLEQEAWYMRLLQASPTLTLEGDVLVLEGGGTRIEYLGQADATKD
jgi:heat shock protein HslJ